MPVWNDPEGKQQTPQENLGLMNVSHVAYVAIRVLILRDRRDNRAPFLLVQYDYKRKPVLIYSRALGLLYHRITEY